MFWQIQNESSELFLIINAFHLLKNSIFIDITFFKTFCLIMEFRIYYKKIPRMYFLIKLKFIHIYFYYV